MNNKIFLSIICDFGLTLSNASAFSLGDAAGALSAVSNTTSSSQKTEKKDTKSTTSNALVGMLSSQLGITDSQAAGGVGSILSYAGSELSSTDYSKLADAIPESDSLREKAPKSNSMLSGVMGLASQFSSLGLDSSMISKFIPVIMNYFKGNNSTDAIGVLSGLFSK